MNGDSRHSPQRPNSRRHNFAAAVVAGAAIGFLYYNFEPAVASEKSGLSVQPVSQNLISEPVRQTASLDIKPEKADEASSSKTNEVADRYALLFIVSQLQRGIEKLEQRSSYSTVFERQERIDGVLSDAQQIEMKIRHAPFSVYMKWKTGDRGRQLLYTDKENEGRMLVKLGGLKGRLVPTLRLEPAGSQAMAECRYPVTQSGLVNLAKQIIHHREKDLKTGVVPQCTIEEGLTFNDRPCYKVSIEYRNQKDSALYWKCMTLIDEQLSLPVYVKNHTWPDKNTVNLEEDTLIECYSYTNIEFEDRLAEMTWQQDNPEYRFVR